MVKVYRLSKVGLRVVYKIRHRGGHGVHSPFAYSLITNAINEKKWFYAYEDVPLYLQECKATIKNKGIKYNRLVFRLINYFNAKNILEIGSGTGLTTLYATAPSSLIKCTCVESSKKRYTKAQQLYSGWNRDINLHTSQLPKIDEKQDCVIIDLKNNPLTFDAFVLHLFPLCHEKSFIIIKNIRTKKQYQALWKKLKQTEDVRVSFDLFNIGILFFDKKFYKRNYRLNF
ncbi:putative O-methyltransferase YrrM [Dysgonomonas sp. PH5-45]|uniref:class I SAM-dependent methyltransferase n=1 Tax=unclassified Dysgonomonas TaxID=2630389 RepID=UPI0024747C99|nr:MULTISPECIES: class I SAM-dependent methyltransferase [unclassified Dysgonomonas]MDH6353854.1 putative O-methyltransferase YrrM [Dysgonomonas sp. PH5-45]MDH6386756.1 putative O-methyltransferase YrrM [Dysgonomonas sp. PH5-37]